MVRILLCLFRSNKCCGCRAVMTVCDIKRRHLRKLACYCSNVVIIGYYPELVTEAVNRRNEIILRRSLCIAHNQTVKHAIVRISEEHWFDICVVYTHVLHTVFFLVAACKLVLLDDAVKVVLNICTDNKAILRLAIHCLGIYVILFLIVLLKPTLFLELLEVLCGLLVHTRVILACARSKVNLGFNYMVKAFLIVACFLARFFRIKHVIRP
ncbi:unknown [Prevotella sp. CAG:1058]|nr:unknown [Prevotella sp. CAG:1058]